VLGKSIEPQPLLPLDDKRYLAAWESDGQDGDSLGVYVRLVDVGKRD